MKYFFIYLLLAVNLFSQSIDIELFKKANKFYSQKKYYKAKKIYESIINSSVITEKDKLLFNLGNSYYNLQMKYKAYTVFKNLISEYPSSKFIKPAVLKIVKYLKDKHKYDEAVRIMSDYYRRSKDKEIGKKIIEIYIFSRKYSEGLKFLDENFSMSEWYLEQKVLFLKHSRRSKEAVDLLLQNIKKYDKLKFYVMLAELYEQSGNLDKAAQWYDKAYTKSKNIEYLINKGRMFIINNRTKDADRVWKNILKLYKYSRKAYSIIANAFKEFGMYNELLKLYNEASAHGFDFTEDKINILEILGRIDEALNEYVKLLNVANYYSIKKKILDIAFINEEQNKVENFLAETIKKKNKIEFIYPILIEFYIKTKNKKNLINFFKSYINNVRLNNIIITDLFNAMSRLSLFSEEIDIFQYMEEKKKLDDALRIKYIEALYLSGKFNKILSVANKISTKKFDKEISFYKGLIYIKKKKFRDAETVLAKYSDDFEFYSLLIDLKIYTGNYKEALKIIEKGEHNKKFNKSELLYKKGFVMLFLDKPSEAFSYFKKLLEIYPDTEFANESGFYCFIYDMLPKDNKILVPQFLKKIFVNDYVSALKVLDKIYIIKRADLIKLEKAELYIKMEQYVDALNELKNINEDYVMPYALEKEADIYMKYMNKPSIAEKIYRKIIKKYPAYVNIQDVRNKILNN